MLISANGEIAIASNDIEVSGSLKHLHQLTTLLIDGVESIENIGLSDGKAGMLLALHCAARHFNKCPELEQAIQQLQQKVCEQAGGTDDTFNNGLFGIGWGIGFLYKHGFITENKTEVLNSFDNELYKLVMYSKADNNSLENGTMGRISYYLHRIPESLKLSNKYSYVCNYEILMLLVDDITTLNDELFANLKSNASIKYLTENNLGEYLSQIFTVLSLLVKEGIHKEITENQWLQLLKYFVTVYEHEHNQVLKISGGAQLNRLFAYNSLLKCALQSKTLADKLTYDKLVCDLSFTPQTIQEAVLYKSYLKNIKRCFGKQPHEYELNENFLTGDMGFGIGGLAGLVCLLAEDVDDNNSTLMEQMFLI
jgi:hypothetical protein